MPHIHFQSEIFLLYGLKYFGYTCSSFVGERGVSSSFCRSRTYVCRVSPSLLDALWPHHSACECVDCVHHMCM